MEQQQTIKIMEKLINIAGLLKECKQYTKLYSVTHGDVLLDRIDKEGNIFFESFAFRQESDIKTGRMWETV